jgi:hypothetical protein
LPILGSSKQITVIGNILREMFTSLHRLKRILIRVLSKFYPEIPNLLLLCRYQLQNKDSYLNVTGWMKSIGENRPCASDGSPVPFMNYPVTTLLRHRLNKNMHLFEYGTGYSTLFFSTLVRNVVSVEYDLAWYERISKDLPTNAKILLMKNDINGEYCRAINHVDGLFDVVVVDGRDRVNCIKQALGKLNDSGVIVLDDSQRQRYQEGINQATCQGFKRLDIEGLKPAEHGVDRTTVLYRQKNCLNL